MLTLTQPQILARCDEFLSAHPRYKMGSGPSRESDLDHAWQWSPVDCSSAATWIVGVAKHEGETWWGTGNIVRDANGNQRRWARIGAPTGRVHVRADWRAPVGSIVVYPGHCGVVVGGTYSRPETVESASSKGGAWRGRRQTGFWARKGAIFCVPRSET